MPTLHPRQAPEHSHTLSASALASAVRNQEAPASSAKPNVELSSNTVVGLGLGFVAAALCVVGFTVLIRVRQIRRALAQARQNGEPEMPFAVMWGRWGGWWGLLFSPNDDVRTIRLKVKQVPKPVIWNGAIAGEPKDALEELDQPLAAGLYGKNRTLGISVLVCMPAEPAPPPPVHEPTEPREDQDQRAQPEDEFELPNVMLGTTFSTSSKTDGIEVQEEREIAQVIEVEMVPTAWQPPPPVGFYQGGTTMWTGPFRPPVRNR